VSEDIDKLERRLVEETIFWEFREVFSQFCNRRRSDLPQVKTPAFKLDLFKLAGIFYYCNESKADPSPALLMDAVEFRSPLMEKQFQGHSEILSQHLLDCFNAAKQQINIETMIKEFKEHKKPGKKAAEKIQDRKRIVRDHIKRQADFYNSQKFMALLKALDKAKIPSPVFRSKKMFDHSWQYVKGDLILEDRVILLLNRDLYKK